MRTYHTEKIVPSRSYRICQAVAEVGIPRRTLARWIQIGRLILTSQEPPMFTGQRLIEALEDRLRRAS